MLIPNSLGCMHRHWEDMPQLVTVDKTKKHGRSILGRIKILTLWPYQSPDRMRNTISHSFVAKHGGLGKTKSKPKRNMRESLGQNYP